MPAPIMGAGIARCDCHGLPMYWSDDSRYRAGGRWYCAERKRERERAAYASLDGFRYARKQFLNRRAKALRRRAARHERLAQLRQEGI